MENICDMLDKAIAAVDRGENKFGSDDAAAVVEWLVAIVLLPSSFLRIDGDVTAIALLSLM